MIDLSPEQEAAYSVVCTILDAYRAAFRRVQEAGTPEERALAAEDLKVARKFVLTLLGGAVGP